MTLTRLEQGNDVKALMMTNKRIWPIIRQCLWMELTSANLVNKKKRPTMAGQLFHYAKMLNGLYSQKHIGNRDATTLFFSRSVYLQSLGCTGKAFDRIVDPLVFLASHSETVQKLYVSPWPHTTTLMHEASLLTPSLHSHNANMIETIVPQLRALAQQADVSETSLITRVQLAWTEFSKWYQRGMKLFSAMPKARRLFVTSWYFPDMMGLIAAAHAHDITTIDVQHGKQGQYQGMYSGWTAIPDDGYEMVPDHFWCWGQPSCDHIMATSRDRTRHTPFVGGFPWLDYYKQFLSNPDTPQQSNHFPVRVLVTLQPPTRFRTDVIPGFVIDYMMANRQKPVHFVFRCHPNHKSCLNDCKTDLGHLPPEQYSIHDGTSNLYDDILQATHHITAFSSCCYEASAFGVPTLLYGPEGKEIYSEEIANGTFTWTAGSITDLDTWLSHKANRNTTTDQPYIVASLDHARSQLLNWRRS